MRMIIDCIYVNILAKKALSGGDFFMKTTEQLKKGDKVRLIDFGKTAPNYRQLLLSLGINRGSQVTVKRVAPLGCPIEIEVLSVCIALRKDEARYLLWE